jgi:peptidoglycan/LPS O-acetylase OafA/YrhL
MKYKPEIDGLRALAVVSVMLFHTGFYSFNGGFIGVDIFFVITGYLMTLIINEDIKRNEFSLTNFYFRRIRRIAPAYFFVILTIIPVSFIVLVPHDFKNFSESLIASATFLANVYFFRNGNYFDVNLQNQPLLHLWSISIETQFYLLFPIFLILLNKFTGKVNNKIIIITVLIILNILALEFSLVSDKTRFYLLIGRFWEFLIGALVAFFVTYKHKNNIKTDCVLSFIGLILIIVSVFFIEVTDWPNLVTLAPTLGAALILIHANTKNITGRILSSKLFTTLGLLSYSIFLIHYPIFVIARINSEQNLSLLTYLLLMLLTFILAYISFNVVENRFRKVSYSKARVFIKIPAFLIIVTLVIGFIGNSTGGFRDFYFENRLNSNQQRALSVFELNTQKDITKRMYSDKDCKFSTIELNKVVIERFNNCYLKYGQALVIFGDSHALNVYNITARSHSPFVFGILQPGCRISSPEKKCFYDEIKKFIQKNQSKIIKVVYNQSGTYLFKDKFGGQNLNSILDSYPQINYDKDVLYRTIGYLNEIGLNIELIWLGSFPEPNIDMTNPRNFTLELVMPEINRLLFAELDNALNIKYSNFDYLSFDEFTFLPDNFVVGNKCVLWNDTDHFSECGEIFISQNLQKYLN